MLAISIVNVWAQKYEWKQVTANGFSYKYVTNDPMGARFYTLKNGLTVILAVILGSLLFWERITDRKSVV